MNFEKLFLDSEKSYLFLLTDAKGKRRRRGKGENLKEGGGLKEPGNGTRLRCSWRITVRDWPQNLFLAVFFPFVPFF